MGPVSGFLEHQGYCGGLNNYIQAFWSHIRYGGIVSDISVSDAAPNDVGSHLAFVFLEDEAGGDLLEGVAIIIIKINMYMHIYA